MQSEKQLKRLPYSIASGHLFLIRADDPSCCDELRVSLSSGTAQIYGVEIKRHFPHTFQMPCVFPIFSWDGAEIQIEWKEENVGRMSDTWLDLGRSAVMPKYLELHYDLTCARKLALENVQKGPRVAILGGQSTGNAAKILLNYAGKLNMRPIFVDLNLDSTLYIDGTIGATLYQYRQIDEVQSQEKLIFCYGNRRIKYKSYLQQTKLLAEAVNRKLDNILKDYSQNGSLQQNPTFSTGTVVQFPSFTEDKRHHKQLIYELIRSFDITHTVVVDSAEISTLLLNQFPRVQRIGMEKLQNTEAVERLKNKWKVQRHLGSECEQVTVAVGDVRLYQYTEMELCAPYCRLMDVRNELINKTAVSILHANNDNGMNQHQVAERAAKSPVRCIARIAKINNQEITFEVACDRFWEECRNKIWISMISEKNV